MCIKLDVSDVDLNSHCASHLSTKYLFCDNSDRFFIVPLPKRTADISLEVPRQRLPRHTGD